MPQKLHWSLGDSCQETELLACPGSDDGPFTDDQFTGSSSGRGLVEF